jgi:NAD(P)H-hydrate epimerase
MYATYESAIRGGVSGIDLMENTGAAVANTIRRRWAPCTLVVLAGPGANGGDGWVIARLLADAGWPVRIALAGDRNRLKGDTAHHAARWKDDVKTASPNALDGAKLIVDALFGAGLSRSLEGAVLTLVAAIAAHPAPIIAVDLPSGVNGDTRPEAWGSRTSPAHRYLLPPEPWPPAGTRALSRGEIITANIGVPDSAASNVQTFQNTPAHWPETARGPDPSGHKYTRGHELIAGGAETTGAARLTALAALRSGAGLAAITTPRRSWPEYAAAELAVIVRPIDGVAGYKALLDDKRFSVLVLGPGLSLDDHARLLVEAAGAAGRKLVLEADALTLFADMPDALFEMTRAAPAAILTPHTIEFRRLFGNIAGSKLEQARAAAVLSGAVIVLRGPDTVIAAPDGRAAINAHAPPKLATASSGDVLAGIITGCWQVVPASSMQRAQVFGCMARQPSASGQGWSRLTY